MVSRTASFGKRVAALPRAVQPRPQAEILPAAPPSTSAAFVARFPYFTLVVTAILGVRFALEVRGATDWTGPYSPGHFSLLAMGASDRSQVLGHGEWWRLFTQTVLHGSPSHLIGNLIAFLVVGLFLEPMIGTGWFAAIYFTGGFGGALLSMLLNPANMLSVGASGAIMATLATLFALSFHPGAAFPTLMRRLSGGALFPALIPSAAHGGTMVDSWAHLGGAVTGALLAFVILAVWRADTDQPRGRSAAAIVAGLWLAMTVFAFAASGGSYVRYAKGGLDTIPAAELPGNDEAMKANSYALVQKYPRDPRAHLYRGLYFLARNDAADAEPYFREAQRLSTTGAAVTQGFTNWNKALLAVTVHYQGRAAEAAAIAAPLCAARDTDLHTRELLDAVTLCH